MATTMDEDTQPTGDAQAEQPLMYEMTFYPSDGDAPIKLPPLNFREFWEATNVIADIGIDRAAYLVNFTNNLAQTLAKQNKYEPNSATQTILTSLPQLVTMDAPENIPTYNFDERVLLDRVLAFTYKEVQRGASYERAAELASSLLEQPFTADAWRKRVRRWAKTKKQAPPAAKRGRPRTKTGRITP